MLVKIGFQVVSCSGEDDRYRVHELNYHGPTVRGWRSPYNCQFPQEIILRLETQVVLHQIQILVHQYLIPQKIEICTKSESDFETPIENSRNGFHYLGFITFSDNQAAGFRSRELKSILIPSKKAEFVKLIIYENHTNNKNVFNQVGIIGINILGNKIRHSKSEYNNNSHFPLSNSTQFSNTSHNLNYISPYDDLAFEMYVDEETAKIIKFLVQKKEQAILKEDFEEANLIKIILEDLRAAGEILGLYEQEKKKAIQAEDFDKAKLKKLQIDDFRKKVYTSLNINYHLNLTENDDNESLPLLDNLNNNEKTKFKNLVEIKQEDTCLENVMSPRRKPSWLIQNNSYLMHSKSQTSFSNLKDFGSSSELKNRHFVSSFSNPQLHQYLRNVQEKNLNLRTGEFQAYDFENGPTRTSSLSDSEGSHFATESLNYGSLPIMPSEVKDEVVEKSEAMNKVHRNEIRTPAEDRIKEVLHNSVGMQNKKVNTSSMKSRFEIYEDRMLPALKNYRENEIIRKCQLTFDQKKKTTLNEKERKQAALPISMFGIETTEKFFSKTFNEKEEGLKLLQEKLKKIAETSDNYNEITSGSYNKIARAAIFLLHRALRDKVYSVYSTAAETIRLFFTEFIPQRVSSSEVSRSVEKLLPELLMKSGDVTPRIHNMAAHTILSIAECEEVRRLNLIPAHLSRPLTGSVHPRLALSRLEMVEQLILNHGISKDKKSGLTCRTLAEFGSSGLHHPAEAVRKVSERILIHVYKVNPKIVRKQLPPDDNVTRRNLLYRQLFQEFDFMDIQRKMAENKKIEEEPQRHKYSSQTCDKKIFELGLDRKTFISNKNNNSRQVEANGKLPNFGNQLQNLVKLNQMEKTSLCIDFSMNSTIPQCINRNGNETIAGIQKDSASKSKDYYEIMDSNISPNKNKKDKSHNDNYKLPLAYTACKNNKTKLEIDESNVKFPCLTDSVENTKAKLLFLQNKNTKSKQTKLLLSENEPNLNKTLPTSKKNSKKHNNAPSGIPLPTFKFARKHYCIRQNCTDRDSIQRPIARNTKTFTSQIKQTDQPIQKTNETQNFFEMGTTCGKEKIKNDDKLSKKLERYISGKNTQKSIRFSESMLASIRENEYSEEPILDEQNQQRPMLKSCIFCLSSDKWLTEASLNMHYLKECPMLTTCEYCTEIIEIPGFTNHLLHECTQKHLFQMCRNCQQPVLADFLNNHECKGLMQNCNQTQCPFCHKYIGNDENCWRNHFIGENICLNHPRPN